MQDLADLLTNRILQKLTEYKFEILKMLKNAYLDAKIGVDPAENEPRKE